MRTKAFVLALILVSALAAWGAVPQPPKTATVQKPAVLLPAGNNFMCGYIDKTGKVVLSGYEDTGDFSDGLASVKMGGRYGFIDSTGKAVIPPVYKDAGRFSEGLARVQVGALWGFVNKTGNMVIEPHYAGASEFSEGLAVVQIDGKFGMIDAKGSGVIPPTYEKMGPLSDGLIAVSTDGKWGFVDKTAASVIAPQFDKVGNFVNGLAPASSGGKYGFIDKTGKWVVEPKYDNAGDFSEGLAPVGLKKREIVKDSAGRIVKMVFNTQWGYIDPTGKEVIEVQFPEIARNFSEGLAPVWKDGKLWYIDKTGKTVLPLPYNSTVFNRDAGGFHNGMLRLDIGWRYGYIDSTGKMVIPQQFRSAFPFSEGLAAVQVDDDLWGYIDQTGQIKITPLYGTASYFNKGYAKVLAMGSWGVIDKLGNFALAPKYDNISWYTDKVVAAKTHNAWGFFDWTGKTILEPQFQLVSALGGTLAVVKKDDKYGVVDANGVLVVAPQYDDSGWLFAEGLLPVSKAGKFGFMDASGKMVISPQFDAASGFSEKLCAVKIGDKWGFIGPDGKPAIAPKYDMAVCFADGLAAVKVGDLWGFIDKTGKTIVNPQFAETGYFNGGLAPVKTGGKWGYIDKTGKTAIPARFDTARDFRNDTAQVWIGNQEAYIDTKGKVIWTAAANQMAKQYPSGIAGVAPAKFDAGIGESDLRVIKVKVAADQIVRDRQGWESIIRQRLQSVSDIFEKNFKIRLEVSRIVEWQSPNFGDDVTANSYRRVLYHSLLNDVPPTDAEIVVAYTGQPSRSPILGFTHNYCNTLIVYDVPTDSEQRSVKITTHEICHMFGATHIIEDTSIMHPTTRADDDEINFDEHTLRQMGIMHGYDFAKGVTSLSAEQAQAADAVYEADHSPGEAFPVANGYYDLGCGLLDSGDYSAAVPAFRKAVEIDGAAADCFHMTGLADALMVNDQAVEGMKVMRQCLDLHTIPTQEAACHDSLADLLDKVFTSEMKYISRMQWQSPTLPDIYMRYTLVRANADEAISEHKKVVALEPENAAYHWALGTSLRSRGKSAEALTEFEKALALSSDDKLYKDRIEIYKSEIPTP